MPRPADRRAYLSTTIGDIDMSKKTKIKRLKKEVRSRKAKVARQQTKLKAARKALKKAA